MNMRRSFGRTISEVSAASIAKALVDVLIRIEHFQSDTDMIFDDALLIAHQRQTEVSLAQYAEIVNDIQSMSGANTEATQ